MVGPQLFFREGILEAGCDEAGRGCLAGPVVAAAVILPPGFDTRLVNDSKQLSHARRMEAAEIIKSLSLAWAVAVVDNFEIDRINILKASFRAMHLAVDQLSVRPELLLIDGNRFTPYPEISHECIVKGDSLYAPIAAASILAKVHRDELMDSLHQEHPHYGWDQNKGYPTAFHQEAIRTHGITPYHRRTYGPVSEWIRENGGE